jgi:hypothetical protein
MQCSRSGPKAIASCSSHSLPRTKGSTPSARARARPALPEAACRGGRRRRGSAAPTPRRRATAGSNGR